MTQSAAQDVQMSRNVHGRTSVAEDRDVRERPDIRVGPGGDVTEALI